MNPKRLLYVVERSTYFSERQIQECGSSPISPPIIPMKHVILFGLCLLVTGITLYIGLHGLDHHLPYGTFLTFIGAITTVGFGIDIVNHIQTGIRKSNIRKLNGF